MLYKHLFLKINKSKLLGRLVLAGHLGVVPIIASLTMPLSLRWVLAIAVVASLRASQRARAAAVGSLQIERDGSCVLTDTRGSLHGHIARASVFPLFVRLVVAGNGRRARTLLVMRDSVEPDRYRALRASVVQQRLPAHLTQAPV